MPAAPKAPKAYLFDFDAPDTGISIMQGGTLGNDAEATFGSGDSGCPAFVQEGGEWRVAGIGTFVINDKVKNKVSGRFGSLGGGMLTVAYEPWLESVLKLK
jgi:hypothetical protein